MEHDDQHYLDARKINWNEIWLKRSAGRPKSTSEFWNKRAPSFTKHALNTPYSDDFIKIMQPDSAWTVFDMGCGSGTLAWPLAKIVKHVTGADFSEKMLEALHERAAAEGITNITTHRLSWDDDWDVIGAKTHDVAIASRSMIVGDFADAVRKLINVARKRVYLSLGVDSGPKDQRLFQALDRDHGMGMDYIHSHNILYQMGIRPNINMITNVKHKIYMSEAEAREDLIAVFLKDMQPEEEARFNVYLQEHLQKVDSGWQLDYPKTTRWAVIWWDVEKDVCPLNAQI